MLDRGGDRKVTAVTGSFLTTIRADGLGILKRESGLTAEEFRKGRNVGEEGAFPHAVQPKYRYDRVRELRRLGAKHRTGSIGVHRREMRSGGVREGPTRKGWRITPKKR